MKDVSAQQVANQIDRLLDKIPLPGETVDTETERTTALSQAIPRQYLVDGMNDAVSMLVSIVKFMDLPALWPDAKSVYAGANGGFSTVPQRPLSYGVKREGEYAIYRPPKRFTRLESSGLAASATNPAYYYLDGEYNIAPSGGNVRIRFVPRPTRITLANLGSARLPVPRRLRRYVVHMAAAQCWRRLGYAGLYQWALGEASITAQPFLRTTQEQRQRINMEVRMI